MRPPTTYIVVDIETDGPVHGLNSMRNLSAVATDAEGHEAAAFSINLAPLPGASPEPGTLAWWTGSQPQAWARINEDPQPPALAMGRFAAFVRTFPGRRIFVGHPLAFDGLWMSHYLQLFLHQGLVPFPGTPDPLFFGAGLDLPSFVAGTLGIDLGACRHGHYPAEVATDLPHTHHGLDDARGHADVLRKALALRRGP